MINEVLIEPATPECAANIAKIEKECFSVPWSEKSILDFLLNDNTVCFTASVSGETVGYIGMYIVCSEGDITNIAVLPEFRNRHIGMLLLRELIHFAQTHEISKIMLEVRESNSAALKLYEKHGFYKVGTRKNYYTQPKENAVLMDKNIDIPARS